MPNAPRALTARERARIELTKDIKQIARRLLSEHGAGGLSLRAVARELGLVSASALYRYFPGRDALLTALIIDAYGSLADAADAAHARLHAKDVLTRWVGVCHAVRDWALDNRHEYALIYGSPVPGYAAPPDTVAPATRVPLLLGGLFADSAAAGEHQPDDHPAVPRRVHRAMQPLLETLPPGLPDGLVFDGLMAWTYLFGAVSFDVFGHRNDIVNDHRSFFDHEIRRLGTRLGLSSGGSSGSRG